ncbi:hypothetical protein C8T65DRAFT_632814 [Cerioporus squamosus]|nr:hypothetical protein C8T65DRAFT_632814 [Cerioporus squamosus]
MTNIYSLPQEVDVHICSYILVRHPVSHIGWEKDTKTLACLATTYSPKHSSLLSTLPADLCVREESRAPDGTSSPGRYIRFIRMPRSLDFSRWKLYSVLVRGITNLDATASSRATTVPPDTWDILALHGPRPLIPCIRALNHRLFARARYPLKVTRLLFGSHLTSYVLAMANPDQELVPHIDALAESSPTLRELHLRWDYASPECVVPLDDQPSTSLTERFVPSPICASCPLSCVTDELWLVTTIFRMVSSALVERLQITHHSSHSHLTSFERLCEVLSRHPSREAMRSLWHSGWLGEPCDLDAAFTYLLALPAITNICLDTSSIVMLSDDTLEAMARTWPRLEKLDLHRYRYDPDAGFDDHFSSLEYRATLKGLSAFAHNCPSLKVLTLPIDPWCNAFRRLNDADAPGWERDFHPVAPSCSELRDLYVGFMDPEYPVEVAAILTAIFPRLKSVAFGDQEEGMYRFPGWETVDRTMRAFQQVQAQERGPDTEQERLWAEALHQAHWE